MPNTDKNRNIVMVDDDVEDYHLVRDALAEVCANCTLHHVRDGDELFEFLEHRGPYAIESPPKPDIILVDLKMPKKDGSEVIRELKGDSRFHQIPVVALTTSTAENDVRGSYATGANSYITKPATYRGLVELLQTFTCYWFKTVKLPPMD